MFTKFDRRAARVRRHRRVRRRVHGTATCPRLAVSRSLQHITAQVIDDVAGHTLASASTHEPALRQGLTSTADAAAAGVVGASVAARAREAGVEQVVFDRGGYPFHGRVATLAQAARQAGLRF